MLIQQMTNKQIKRIKLIQTFYNLWNDGIHYQGLFFSLAPVIVDMFDSKNIFR